MSLHRKRLDIAFFMALLALLSLPSVSPSWRLTFFAPFLIITYYQKPYIRCLWLALLCGVIMDILSFQTRLGLHALNYCVTTAILYRQKRHFFADSVSTLPLMTYFFAFLSTVLQYVLLYMFDTPLPLSWRWVFVDVLMMPATDAVYAFVCFQFPTMIVAKPARKAKDYFLER